MVVGNDLFGVESGRDRNAEKLGQTDHLSARARGGNTSAGYDDRALGLEQNGDRGGNRRGLWPGAERWVLGEALLENRLEVGLLLQHLSMITSHVQVHRAR